MTTNAALNYHLAICKQIYGEIVKVVPLSELRGKKLFSEKERSVLRDFALRLYVHLREVKEHLEIPLMKEDVPIQQVSEGLATFYSDVLADNLDTLMNLHWQIDPIVLDLGELGLITMDSTPNKESDYEDASEDDSVRTFMLAAVERCESILDEFDGTVFTEWGYERALKLLAARFYRPDSWLENLALLKPVITPKATSSFPSHVRSRLREIYDSFVFGNWLAVMSLSRSLLEYMILDRHSSIGIDAYSEDGGKKSPKRLNILTSLVSAVLPDIREQMEYVVDSGNDVMHPRKRNNITVIIPNNAREQAFNCVSHVRNVAERLYVRNITMPNMSMQPTR